MTRTNGIRWFLCVGLMGSFLAGLGCDPEEGEEVTDREGEACETKGDQRECGENDVFNVCDSIDGELQWGECHQLECTPGDTTSCGEVDGTATCEIDDGVPYWQCVDGTPLVLSFDGAEPVMSDASAAPAFDVGTGGACIQTDWPASDTPWLALDRDHSGTIDGGHELFGSGTVLTSGRRAQHGFSALAELDSNGDGRITRADARFDELVLWADHDRDKRSTPAEQEPLAMRGIVAIELGWRDDAVCDPRGNCGVERAAFSFIGAGGRVSTGEVVDVHLPCR